MGEVSAAVADGVPVCGEHAAGADVVAAAGVVAVKVVHRNMMVWRIMAAPTMAMGRSAAII